MANMNADAIITRVRELLEDGAGSVRFIGSNTYQGGLYVDLDDSEQSLRALEKPRAETGIRVLGRNPASPPITGTFALLDIEVRVTVVRHLNPDHKLDDDMRDDIKALAASDADVLFQALTWPGNMASTAGGTPTGLVSGCLRYDGSEEPEIELGEEAGRITTIHRFSGIVNVATVTS